MKKILIAFSVFVYVNAFAQFHANSANALDSAIENIWVQDRISPYSFQDVGPEVLFSQSKQLVAPILTPARARVQIPGSNEILLPVEVTEGPLYLSPNDTKAYILYNQATIAHHKKQFEKARVIYRDLVRQYPDSSYTPYALYTLSISEPDYRRKIRILLTIKEKFPDFPHKTLILDRLGDLYYLLDSPGPAEEAFALSGSVHALYMQTMLSLDKHKPKQAITQVRSLLKSISDKELAYQAYIVYTEALFLLKEYSHMLTVLKKAVELRPWAYDNGALVLLHAGRSLFFANRFEESLYVFSLLRLRFSRSSESRIADQYIVVLGQQNVVDMKTVPWIARHFDVMIKEQPVVRMRTPRYPTISEILQMNTELPKSAIKEPSLSDIAFVPPMPKPEAPLIQQDVLVPISKHNPQIEVELLRFTNFQVENVTNLVYQIETNMLFVVETNTITNNFLGIDLSFETNIIDQTNTIDMWRTNVITNVVQTFETNTVMLYEPVVIWQTNSRNLNCNNYLTNLVDQVVTNERVNYEPVWKNKYNLIGRSNALTNVITKIYTNHILEIQLDKTSNWTEQILTNQFVEIIPAGVTSYRTLDSNMRMNVVQEVVTNQHFHIVPTRKKTCNGHSYDISEDLITNTKLHIAPLWTTNYQYITTNVVDYLVTNLVPTISEFTNMVLTSPISHSTEMAPVCLQNTAVQAEHPQILPISDPIDEPIEDTQEISIFPEALKLEKQVAKLTEQSAGIAGQYEVPDNKGYVVRIAEVQSLAVANIIIQDIEKLQVGVSPAIYYRDDIYYVEARQIEEYDLAQELVRELYKIGYADVQLFEQFEITRYQDH